MKNRTMLYLLFFQLIALTLLFPYTPKGEQFMQQFFPQGNLREEELIPTPSPTPQEPPSPPPTQIPLSLFYTKTGTELPGYYDLVSIRTENDEFSDGLLLRLRQLGVPMILELKEDGNLDVVSLDGQDALSITRNGSDAVAYVEEDLPLSVRSRALDTVRRFLRLDRHARENAVEITPSGDGFNVCFSLNTGDTKLMELNMYVVSRDQAELLRNNYLEDPTHLYSSILTALMLD